MNTRQPPSPKPRPQKGRQTLLKLILAEIIVLLMLAAGIIGAMAGYQDGVRRAGLLPSTGNIEQVDEQYQLGVQDFENGRYDLARQRFEYVIALDAANYPNAWEYLTKSLEYLNATATFTPPPPTQPATATITLTPTRDPSGVESIYNRAQSLMAAGDWEGAITALLALRNEDIYYRVVEVDDALYAALRNRGANRILAQGDLEGGIYDLTLAESFGPLDYEADVYRDWARLYLTALGFWEAYPEQAVYYFGQIAAALPGLRDGAGWSAGWRYHWSLIHYGDLLASEGDWCAAQQQYEAALGYGSNQELQPTLTYVAHRCSPPTWTSTPIPPTAGPSATASATALVTATSTGMFTNTPTTASTNTLTSIPTHTNTSAPAPTATNTPIPAATNTNTPVPVPTNTNTSIPAPTATNTLVPSPTNTSPPAVPTATPTP